VTKDITFQEAWNYKCRNCGARACEHRITSSGTLYCLQPGWNKTTHKDILAMRQGLPTVRDRDIVLNTCKVSELRKSPINSVIGKKLMESMVGYISETQ